MSSEANLRAAAHTQPADVDRSVSMHDDSVQRLQVAISRVEKINADVATCLLDLGEQPHEIERPSKALVRDFHRLWDELKTNSRRSLRS